MDCSTAMATGIHANGFIYPPGYQQRGMRRRLCVRIAQSARYRFQWQKSGGTIMKPSLQKRILKHTKHSGRQIGQVVDDPACLRQELGDGEQTDANP